MTSPAVAATPDGEGYWLVASDGGIFTFDAPFAGPEGGHPVERPHRGHGLGPGYRLVASDGGIFVFGGASFPGSQGGTRLNAPMVGMVDVGGRNGYWSVGSDGGIFGSGA